MRLLKMRILLTIVSFCIALVILADDTWQYIIDKHGYDPATVTNLTESAKIKLAEPVCAYVNITGISQMPTKKTQDLNAWLECYDGNGNYFKKRVILNAQGNSSMRYVKKNIKIDFCEDEWKGEKETDITIGQWVKQSSFHLKANYTTYFRGESQIGYMIYDDLIADRQQPFPWQRAGITDANEKALCHPQGFPCYVYLNGKFYGLYAWQLKKNHKNMGQTKNLAEHIHIDGTLKNENFWNGNINWTTFEIRNPKTLYCVNTVPKDNTTAYAEYNGDSPCEPIDASMPYFDTNNEGHVLSDAVKKYVIKLSQHKTELSTMMAAKADTATIRATFERYFDVQGMLDYAVMSYVTSNGDGFEKNWQWITYDGIKWYVMPYDLDCIFGNMWRGTFLFPAETFWFFAKYDHLHQTGPMYIFLRYYKKEIADRYKRLRHTGTISCNSFMSHFHSWYERITREGYDFEYTKWTDSPCNREPVISDKWTTSDQDWLTHTWDDYYKIMSYDDKMTYKVGDKCTLEDRIWTATAVTQGIKPFTKLGHTDSMERVENYVNRKIKLLDDYFGYDPSDDGIQELPSTEQPDNQPVARKVIRDKHLYIIKDNETYSVDGKRVR